MVDDRTLTREQIREWVLKHLADFPEHDEAWRREVLNIYRAGRSESAEAVAPAPQGQ